MHKHHTYSILVSASLCCSYGDTGSKLPGVTSSPLFRKLEAFLQILVFGLLTKHFQFPVPAVASGRLLTKAPCDHHLSYLSWVTFTVTQSLVLSWGVDWEYSRQWFSNIRGINRSVDNQRFFMCLRNTLAVISKYKQYKNQQHKHP